MSDYEYKEFPKWVTVGENAPVLCEDKEAEMALTGEAVEAEKPKRGRPAKAVEAE